jgi:hypothetical protein
MNSNALLGALCAALLVAAPSAQAITLTSTSLGGNDNNGVLIGADTLGVDVGLRGFSPATFTFTKGLNSAASYDFSSVIENLIRFPFGSVQVSLLGGATFAGIGSVTPGFGTIDSITLLPAVGSTSLTVAFGANGEPFGVNIGNPLGAVGLADWTISLGNADSFSVEFAATPIPVPGGLVLLLSGLAGFAVMSRRRKA